MCIRDRVKAAQPLHGQVELTFARLTMRDVGDDAGVTQLRQQLRFAKEATGVRHGAGCRLTMKDLQRNRAIVGDVAGLVDHAHAAFASNPFDGKAMSNDCLLYTSRCV